MTDADLLPHLPADLIRAAYAAAPGNEIASGKFKSSESSAALAANGFGFFLNRPGDLPCPLPELFDGWAPTSVRLEAEVRFPWSGGRHPWLDTLVLSPDGVLGIESKRYEPFRGKPAPRFSEAFDRPVWGDRMGRYLGVRAALTSGALNFKHLDAAQLVKHGLALRTAAASAPTGGRQAALLYLFAEPATWGDGRPLNPAATARHREEIAAFAGMIAGDEVRFLALAWSDLLASWEATSDVNLRRHASAVRMRFAP